MQIDEQTEPARTAYHFVPPAHFDALAAGRGGPETVRFLQTTEYSRRLVLLRALLDAIAATPHALGPLPPVDSAWDTLTAAQERAPEDFQELLLHPQIGIWLGHGLRRLRGATTGDGPPLWSDLGHLYAVCSVAALRAGLSLRTAVPLRDGTAMFPTLGLACLPAPQPWGAAEVVVEAGRLTVGAHGERVGPPRSPRPPDGDAPGWQGLRRLRGEIAGRPAQVWLDDIDPYRDLSEPLPPERLGEDELTCWQERFGLALELLADSDRSTAAAVAEGLRTVATVPPGRYGAVLSASSGDGFGGMLTSLPPDPATFAVTLVHEFQHTKLGGLLHLLTLHRDSDDHRYYAPWRNDPRPLSGLLQGAYAFLGITEFWWRYLDKVPADRQPLAEFEFALRRQQTQEAVRALAADPGLTAHGLRFVRGMAARLPEWWTDKRVRPDIGAMAELAATDHRTGWRIRHLAPAPADVRALAQAYAAGADPGAGQPLATSEVVPDLTASGSWSHARTGLIRQRLADRPGGDWPEPSAADLALAAGDPAAPEAYARLLADDPEAPEPWTGLALALARTAGAPAARALLRHPELPRAVHRELRATTGTAADPKHLALWIAASRV